MKISEVAKYFEGGTFLSKEACEKGVKWLKITNVGINKIKWEEKSYLPINYIKQYSEYLLKIGDIVMALTRKHPMKYMFFV